MNATRLTTARFTSAGITWCTSCERRLPPGEPYRAEVVYYGASHVCWAQCLPCYWRTAARS